MLLLQGPRGEITAAMQTVKRLPLQDDATSAWACDAYGHVAFLIDAETRPDQMQIRWLGVARQSPDGDRAKCMPIPDRSLAESRAVMSESARTGASRRL